MATIPMYFESEDPQAPTPKGHLGGGLLTPKPEKLLKEVDADTIKASLSELTGKLAGLFDDIKAVGDFRLSTVQLAVQISASGGVSLVADAKAGASGTISLTFTENTEKADPSEKS